MMKYFQFFPADQSRTNRLVYSELREPPQFVLKSQYTDCVCPRCERIDYDQAFANGFDEVQKMRAKGDMFGTEDGFICVNGKVKLIIDAAQFRGICLKPAGQTGWWVVNVSLRVESDPRVYTMKNPCDSCGRPKQVYGKICCVDQIDLPTDDKTVFSPILERSVQTDRDLFVTEDVVRQFKVLGVKGGAFSRLLTRDEYEAVRAANALMDPDRWPKDSHVIL